MDKPTYSWKVCNSSWDGPLKWITFGFGGIWITPRYIELSDHFTLEFYSSGIGYDLPQDNNVIINKN